MIVTVKVTVDGKTWNDGQGAIAYYMFKTQKNRRLFMWDRENNTVTQVVASVDKKKGRPNMLGVYRISEVSFRSNYYWYWGRGNKLTATTKKLFDYWKDKVVESIT